MVAYIHKYKNTKKNTDIDTKLTRNAYVERNICPIATSTMNELYL